MPAQACWPERAKVAILFAPPGGVGLVAMGVCLTAMNIDFALNRVQSMPMPSLSFNASCRVFLASIPFIEVAKWHRESL